MHSIRVHKVINRKISWFRLFGFWHPGNEPTARKWRLKFFYCIYHPLFCLSLGTGAITNENRDKSIFLTEIFIAMSVISVKLWTLVWKQRQIEELLDGICVFSIRDDNDFSVFNKKLEKFMNFTVAFSFSMVFGCFLEAAILPFLGNERTLFFNIAFPFDWRNNEIAFWMANIFIFTQMFIVAHTALFSVIIWYLLLNCALRYEVLGSEVTKMGYQQNSFLQDLSASIGGHLRLRKYA